MELQSFYTFWLFYVSFAWPDTEPIFESSYLDWHLENQLAYVSGSVGEGAVVATSVPAIRGATLPDSQSG